MPKKALIIQGGWEGHFPEEITQRYQASLPTKDFEVTIADKLEAIDELDLPAFDLIVPNWTMGDLSESQEKAICEAVASGVGLGGVHGGMGDAFRGKVDYNYMVGGQFVGHPYVGPYTVRVEQPDHPLTRMLPERFVYDSEQYYLHVDPALNVLVATDYDVDGLTVDMPVAWTKKWGRGRVFYCALGHAPAEFDAHPYVWDFVIEGCIWACR
ncbi:MAG: ThuA domain-containing protein [Verrucomicrobiota bacterium]